MLNRGYQEEVIRLARRLFAEVDWAESCAAYKDFDAVLERCLTAMVQVGHPATEALLERYEQAMPGKGAQYILLCDLRCYAYWYSERYDLAIHWGERGAKLKDASAVDTAFSTKHNLALSLRDGGRVAHALEMFLDGEALEVVTRPGERVAGRGAHFYGNEGRCLFVAGKPASALACYVKSAQLLDEDRGHRADLNKGYIRSWIAELLTQRGERELAAASYRAAACIWKETSPPRSDQAAARLRELVGDHSELGAYCEEAQWRVEERFGEWLNRQ